MLVKVWITVFFIVLSRVSLAQELKYPSYEAVVKQFFNSYHFVTTQTQTLRFEKRPLGWYVRTVHEDETSKSSDLQLFWDKQLQSYQLLAYPKFSNEEVLAAEEVALYLQNEYEKRSYALFPFYGYEGWDSDFINIYKNKPKLGDTLLQALARAYSLHGSNLLHNNSGLADPKLRYKLPAGKNSLSTEQLRTYRKYKHSAIDCYRKLYRSNPNYETLLGNAHTYMSNEHMLAFLELRIYQNEQEARKELAKGLYSEFMISTAKNFLAACDSHAILFTGNDLDTYPLLYVQAQYGFRTDVAVVNCSLLNTDRYINSFRDKIGNSEPLPLSFSRAQAESEALYWIHLRDIDVPVSVSSLIDYVSTESNFNNGLYSFPNNHLELYKGKDTLRWVLDKPYLTKSDLMILDIINNNHWERPICFSASMGRNNYLFLHKYLQHRGLVYQLIPVSGSVTPVTYGSAYVNTESLYDLLLNKYDWKGMKAECIYEKNYVSAYRQSFIMLSQQLIAEKKYKEAKLAMEFCFTLFPRTKIPLDYTTLYFIENHYKIDEIAQANEIAKAFLYDMKHQLGDFKRSDPAYTAAIRDYLRDFFSKYRQEDMLNLMDEPY